MQEVNKVLIGPYIILLEPWLALQWTINSETVSASASILIDPVISSFCKKNLQSHTTNAKRMLRNRCSIAVHVNNKHSFYKA